MPLENETPETVTPPVAEITPPSTTSSESENSTPTPAETAPSSEDTLPPLEVPAVEPDEYEIETSEDSPLTEEELNEIAADAERLNLSKEDAQKLVTLKESAYKKGAEAGAGEYVNIIRENTKAFEAAPDFQGEAGKESFRLLNRAVQAYGDPELVEAMKNPMYGNLLPLARLLTKIGKAMGPDTSAPDGKGTVVPPKEDKERANLRAAYPDFFQNN